MPTSLIICSLPAEDRCRHSNAIPCVPSKYKTPTSVFPEHRGSWALWDHFHSSFPFWLKKKTAETDFWDNFLVLHAGDVNQNGGILPSVFVKYGHKLGTFFRKMHFF
jgi:hypothetical protein